MPAEVMQPFSTALNAKLTKVTDKGLALRGVRAEVDRLAKSAKDFSVPLKDVKFLVNGFPTGVGVRIGKKEYGLTPWAMSQLGNRMEVPASFLWKLYQHNRRELLLRNLTELQKFHAERELMFRTVEVEGGFGTRTKRRWNGPVIRGVVTPTFTATDNNTVLDALEEILPAGFHTQEYHAHHESLVIRLVNKELGIRERKIGSFAGLMIENSEVGRRSLSISMFVYRLVCSNGMIAPQALYTYRRRHTGEAITEFSTEMGELLPKLPEYAKKIEAATAEARGKVLTRAQVQRLLETSLDDVDAAKPLLAVLNDRETVLKALWSNVKHEAAGTNNRFTKWGVINAFTRMSHGLPTEPRQRVESFAGRLLLASRN